MLPADWLDSLCDAQRLPFADESFDNIVILDVLHHLGRTVRFFGDASLALKPGILPISGVFYRALHHQPVDMSADPLEEGPIDPTRDPYDSN